MLASKAITPRSSAFLGVKLKSLGLMWVTLLGESYVIRVGSDPVALVILGERPTRQPIARLSTT
jgi:hypothetical protein